MERLIEAMMEYDKGDAARIQHFLKVYELAKTIGKMEKLDDKTQFILETAALVHDIGIHKAEEKYGSSSGKYQEMEGPGQARALLDKLNWPEDVTERVCFLVGHHHTYAGIDSSDWQILVEADFLVNLYEDSSSRETRENVYRKIFKTEGGKRLFGLMYGLEAEA